MVIVPIQTEGLAYSEIEVMSKYLRDLILKRQVSEVD